MADIAGDLEARSAAGLDDSGGWALGAGGSGMALLFAYVVRRSGTTERS